MSEKKKAKGHWPAGKRRHPSADLEIRRLARLLRHPERKRISRRAAAAACGVSERAVRRWLDRTDVPNAAAAKRLAAWIEKIKNP